MTSQPEPAGPTRPEPADVTQPVRPQHPVDPTEPVGVEQPVDPTRALDREQPAGHAQASRSGTSAGPSVGATAPGAATPQDAPLDRPWPQAAQPAATMRPAPAPGMQPAPSAGRVDPPRQPSRRVIPPPTGANWALVLVALLLVLAAAAEIAYLLGYRPDGTMQIGPGALIGAGALLVLVGLVGLLGQRRSRAVGSNRQPDGDRG